MKWKPLRNNEHMNGVQMNVEGRWGAMEVRGVENHFVENVHKKRIG